jgi:anti-sigma B factor antagonist
MQQSALSPDFVCDVHPDRDRVIVRLGGELDLATAPEVGTTVHDLFDAGFTSVVVDLRQLTFLDSTGIHTLVSAQRSAERRECSLSLLRGPRSVHRVFELTGTDSLFAFDAGMHG